MSGRPPTPIPLKYPTNVDQKIDESFVLQIDESFVPFSVLEIVVLALGRGFFILGPCPFDCPWILVE